MSKEDVLAQLRARRVPESNFLGKGGGARQAATLRKLLLRWDADETAETAPPAPPAAVQAASHDPAPADLLPRPALSAKLRRSLQGSTNWAACDNCSKWRRLPKGREYDGDHLPEEWTCSLNPDPTRNRCTDPEEEMEKNEEWDGNVEEGDEDDSDFNAADAESESGSEAEEGATERGTRGRGWSSVSVSCTWVMYWVMYCTASLCF